MYRLRRFESLEENIGETLYCKTHETENMRILACCDKELVGKTLKQQDIEIEIKESFYKGEKITVEELEEILGEYGNINLFGNKAVTTALKQGFLRKEDIIKIQGVMHAIILRV